MSKMQRLWLVLVLLAGLTGGAGISRAALGPSAASEGPVPTWQAKVDPWVLQHTGRGDTEFLIYLNEQADLSGAASLATKAEKGTYVYRQLTATAARTQSALTRDLARRGVEYRPYWVANMIWVRGDADLVQALAERSDVAHLYANPVVRFRLPESFQSLSLQAPTALEWNIEKVNAPVAWAAGYRGQGAVIAGQDTGYQWDHPALKNQYRGWNGSTADHNYNWHDAIHTGAAPCGGDSSAPCDEYGHGTHTMGTMVGDDGAGTQIGMAPEARWIGCRNMDNGGNGTPASYSECFQWFIAPTNLNNQVERPDLAPDVINNSWGCTVGEGCTDPNMLKTVIENTRAAGIEVVASAGNDGAGCNSVHEPPAVYSATFSVAALDSADLAAGFSSRGPVSIDGSNRPKPDISAPGVWIRSSTPGNSYGISSGTSMAAPHVAGLVAVLISARPQLKGHPQQIETILKNTAVGLSTSETCGGTAGQVPNNVYGWGRIDAGEAISRLEAGLEITKTVSARQITPGERLTYTLTITNHNVLSATHTVWVTDTLPLQAVWVSASPPYTRRGEQVEWSLGTLPAGASRSVTLTVQVPLTATGTLRNQYYGARSSDFPSVSGQPVQTDLLLQPQFSLAPRYLRAVQPGSVFRYTHWLTNTGLAPDTYTLTLFSTSGWAVLLAPPTLTLQAGQAVSLTISMQIPVLAQAGQVDTSTLAARSFAHPGFSMAVMNRTSIDQFYTWLGGLFRIHK